MERSEPGHAPPPPQADSTEPSPPWGRPCPQTASSAPRTGSGGPPLCQGQTFMTLSRDKGSLVSPTSSSQDSRGVGHPQSRLGGGGGGGAERGQGRSAQHCPWAPPGRPGHLYDPVASLPSLISVPGGDDPCVPGEAGQRQAHLGVGTRSWLWTSQAGAEGRIRRLCQPRSDPGLGTQPEAARLGRKLLEWWDSQDSACADFGTPGRVQGQRQGSHGRRIPAPGLESRGAMRRPPACRKSAPAAGGCQGLVHKRGAGQQARLGETQA